MRSFSAAFPESRFTWDNRHELETVVGTRLAVSDENTLVLKGVTVGWYRSEFPSQIPFLNRIYGLGIWGMDHIIPSKDVKWGVEFTGSHVSNSIIKHEADFSLLFKSRVYISDRFYYSFGVGPAYNRLRENHRPEMPLRLGSRWFFGTDLVFGYEREWRNRKLFVDYVFTHRSNGNIARSNQSLNFHGLSVGAVY